MNIDPARNCLPASGVTVRVIAEPDVAEVGLAVMLSPVKLPMVVVPSLYFRVPAFSCIPKSGVIVRLIVVPAVAVVGLVILPPVKLPMLTLYVSVTLTVAVASIPTCHWWQFHHSRQVIR